MMRRAILFTANDDLTDQQGDVSGKPCYICGKIIEGGEGHYVALMTGDGNSDEEGEPLYIIVLVCNKCDQVSK